MRRMRRNSRSERSISRESSATVSRTLYYSARASCIPSIRLILSDGDPNHVLLSIEDFPKSICFIFSLRSFRR